MPMSRAAADHTGKLAQHRLQYRLDVHTHTGRIWDAPNSLTFRRQFYDHDWRDMALRVSNFTDIIYRRYGGLAGRVRRERLHLFVPAFQILESRWAFPQVPRVAVRHCR